MMIKQILLGIVGMWTFVGLMCGLNFLSVYHPAIYWFSLITVFGGVLGFIILHNVRE